MYNRVDEYGLIIHVVENLIVMFSQMDLANFPNLQTFTFADLKGIRAAFKKVQHIFYVVIEAVRRETIFKLIQNIVNTIIVGIPAFAGKNNLIAHV